MKREPDMGIDAVHAKVCRGAAAILEALSNMGVEGKNDHDFAKPIVDAELDVRALIAFAMTQFITTD